MSKRKTAMNNSAGAAGTISESRMKSEEGKGGSGASNGGRSLQQETGRGRGSVGLRVYRKLKRNQSDSVVEKESRSRTGADKTPIQLRKTRSDSHSQGGLSEILKPDGSKVKNLKGILSNEGEITDPKGEKDDIPDEDHHQEGEGGGYEFEDEEEMEKEMFDIKEMNPSEQVQKEVEDEEEKKLLQIPEISVSENSEKRPINVIEHPTVDELCKRPHSLPVSEAFESTQENYHRIQNLVDLVMWRDISKSALIFGFGTFILISSSFTRDVQFSFISAISYLGLVYLAATFFYKSFICKGTVDSIDLETRYIVLGEEEVIWILRKVLPYFNEILFKIRCRFSGDPATTMKLAILLFVLARCGSSITIWTMLRLAFFGAFTVPKFCSIYSNQLSTYGRFWVRRFKDAWDSCTHKKAVAIAIFTIIWNLSSVVARIWAAFILIVAVRFYQQTLVAEEWVAEEVHEDTDNGGQGVDQKKDGPKLLEMKEPNPAELRKEKKGS